MLVHIWSSESERTREEMPELVGLYGRYHDRGLEIVGISLDSDARNASLFANDWTMRWPLICQGKEWNSPLIRQLGVRSLPANNLLDKQLVLRGIDLRGQEIEAEIQRLLGTPPAPGVNTAQLRTEPAVFNPGDTVRVDYLPIRKSHQRAQSFELMIRWSSATAPREVIAMQPVREEGKPAYWTSVVQFPKDQVSLRLVVGDRLQNRPCWMRF